MEINEKVVKLRAREKELQTELAYWETEFQPSGNMGKWGRQVKVDSLTEKLKKVQEKIEFHDNLYLSNEIYKQWKEDAVK
jgi:hypothetical protein